MKLLSKQIEILQRNSLDSLQYLRREMIEINPVPEDIQDTLLEESICQALPLTRTLALPGDREACHKMRRKDRVIVKFSSRKKRNYVFIKKETHNWKIQRSGKLGIYVRKAINDSMCYENHQLFYRDAGS